MGRAGSRKPKMLARRVGLGHNFYGSGRVVSQNLDLRATLAYRPIVTAVAAQHLLSSHPPGQAIESA